jgi:hypothetical protein
LGRLEGDHVPVDRSRPPRTSWRAVAAGLLVALGVLVIIGQAQRHTPTPTPSTPAPPVTAAPTTTIPPGAVALTLTILEQQDCRL